MSLNEIIDELEQLDDDDPFPRSVTILPPENANADVTDEDSDNEEYVTLNNLPGSQLRAPTEIEYMSADSDDDDVPLSSFAKKSRTTEESLIEEPEPSTSSSAQVISSTLSIVPFIEPTVPHKQKYTWRNRHNSRVQLQWQENHGPRYLQSPVYYFDCMFVHGVIELLVKYTNIYANQKNKVGNVTTNEMKCFLESDKFAKM